MLNIYTTSTNNVDKISCFVRMYYNTIDEEVKLKLFSCTRIKVKQHLVDPLKKIICNANN